MANRARLFVFTLNNPSMSDDDFHIDGATFYVFQREKGLNNTEHLQGAVLFKNARTFTSVRRLIPRAHVEIAKGTLEECITYCSKEDTRVSGPFMWCNTLRMSWRGHPPSSARSALAPRVLFPDSVAKRAVASFSDDWLRHEYGHPVGVKRTYLDLTTDEVLDDDVAPMPPNQAGRRTPEYD